MSSLKKAYNRHRHINVNDTNIKFQNMSNGIYNTFFEINS